MEQRLCVWVCVGVWLCVGVCMYVLAKKYKEYTSENANIDPYFITGKQQEMEDALIA